MGIKLRTLCPSSLLKSRKSSLTATGLLYKCLSFTTVGAPTDGVGVPSPQHRQEGTMTTYPARGVVFITLSCLGWGEGTPTPSVGSCFLAQIVAKDKHKSLLSMFSY